MPKFETPDPISVTLEIGVGNLRITATDRADTVVEVRPADDTDESDVQAAAQVKVDYANGTLQINGPRRMFDFSKKTRAVDVTIELPAGSHFDGNSWMGDVRCAGRLGECKLKVTGNVWIEQTGRLSLHTGMGHVTIDNVTGSAEISSGNGKIEIGAIDGSATVKNSNGDTTIDTVTGELRARAANGSITIGHAGAGVDAKSSNGNVRAGEVVCGSVVLGTAAGDLDIGIAEGTAAWLQVDTGFGHVRNDLENAPGPGEAAQTVEVRAHTSYGDITIHHA